MSFVTRENSLIMYDMMMFECMYEYFDYVPGKWVNRRSQNILSSTLSIHRTDSRFAPSQWETALLCNDVSHWLGASLKSALYIFLAIPRHVADLCTYGMMMTSWHGNILHITGPLWGESTNPQCISHTRGQWYGALELLLLLAKTVE